MNIRMTTGLAAIASLIIGGCASTPYSVSQTKGIPWPIPGIIHASNFDRGGEGVAYHDATAANNGGHGRLDERVDVKTVIPNDPSPSATDRYHSNGLAMGWIDKGEWLRFTVNVTQSGVYTVLARVATPRAEQSFHIEMDGVDVTGPIRVPANEKQWDDAWETVFATGIKLRAGQHAMRFVADSSGFDLQYFTWILPPTAAADAGYTRLAFYENFDSTAGVDIEDTGKPGFNFYRRYPWNWGSLPVKDIMGIENSVMTFKSEGGPNIGLCSACGTGDGKWTGFTAAGGAYFEARLAFNPDNPTKGKGWPSFWADPAEWFYGKGKPYPTLEFLEMDFMEFPSHGKKVTKEKPYYWGTMHDWRNSVTENLSKMKEIQPWNKNRVDVPVGTDFNALNTYGAIWVPGDRIDIYFNDAETNCKNPFSKYPFYKVGDNQHFTVIIGSDGWPMKVDWVKVWTKP